MEINMNEFYTVEELATLLRVQPHTVRQWTYQKRVPYIKLQGLKGRVLFKRTAIEQWLEDNTVPTMQEISKGRKE